MYSTRCLKKNWSPMMGCEEKTEEKVKIVGGGNFFYTNFIF